MRSTALLLILVGCSQTTQPPNTRTDTQPTVEKSAGEEVYTTYCSACHGTDGQGNDGQAADFVNDKSRLAKADGELFQSIWKGKGSMPSWRGIITKKQVQQVILYIRETFGKQKKVIDTEQ